MQPWDKDSDKVAFTNSYDTKTGISLTGTKSSTEERWKRTSLAEVKDAAGKKVAEGKNNADGTISLETWAAAVRPGVMESGRLCIQQGLYYTVKRGAAEGATEEITTRNGITYDTSKFTVK